MPTAGADDEDASTPFLFPYVDLHTEDEISSLAMGKYSGSSEYGTTYSTIARRFPRRWALGLAFGSYLLLGGMRDESVEDQ